MASSDQNMKIKLLVENTQANKSLKDTNKHIKDTEKQSKKTGSSLERMRVQTSGLRRSIGALRNNLLLVSFAFGGTVAAISKTIKAFGEQELAEKKLETAIGRTSQSLLDQASALQQVTTFGDESIIQVQALIGAFTKDEESIKKATKATLDLAAAKGMDLFSAADLVSKTLGSSTNAMSRYGISVTGAVGSTERLNTLTKNIANTFGGQASAQADTLTGKFKQMQHAAGDTGEAIGGLLAKPVGFLADQFTKASEGATEFIKSLQEEKKEINENNPLLNRNAKFMQGLANVFDFSVEKMEKLLTSGSLLRQQQEDLKNTIVSTELPLKEQAANLEKIEEREIRRMEIAPITLEDIKAEAEENMQIQERQKKYFNDQARREEKLSALREKLARKSVSDMAIAAKAFPEMEKASKRASQVQALVDTYAGANAAFKAMAGIPGVGPALGIAAAGAAIAAGLANVKMIEKAETGMDRIVQEPTLIMAGEGNKAEHVEITPLEGPNISGPQGAGAVTVNVSAPLVDDTVVDSIIPAIKEAVRRGEDIGIG